MVYGSNSPINWILNLRSYGTAIRNNTTAAGWIEWSDDGQKLTYKSLELSLNNLRWAIHDQVKEAQEQLNHLLLLPDSEPDTRARMAYIQLVYVYLERLLLLIHILGGQPARGTELLTLRWRNSTYGDIRSIFVDNGMLCFVTSYHKNYSTSSTTWIIHRYLPPEIGELMLYYLWLITPFLDALYVLSKDLAWQAPDIGSYLWPDSMFAAVKGRKLHMQISQRPVEEPWPSSHLGVVIKKLLAAALSTTILVLLWRYAAIAMSRKHLLKGF
ncbi:hypothetical protein E8E13_000416 [Curvularia kusanoi]|uniref:Uncharacterized protein n=1 Tax=Curvularia kusanoi TaxID=90978 RepID=A0A9P4T2D1_CURKU|nr:hypothetical protein E8E13_000416 [Curvularia kusanoi]